LDEATGYHWFCLRIQGDPGSFVINDVLILYINHSVKIAYLQPELMVLVDCAFLNRYKREVFKLLQAVRCFIALRRLEYHATTIALLDLIVVGPGSTCIKDHSDSVYYLNDKIVFEEYSFKLARSIIKNLVDWVLI